MPWAARTQTRPRVARVRNRQSHPVGYDGFLRDSHRSGARPGRTRQRAAIGSGQPQRVCLALAYRYLIAEDVAPAVLRAH